MNANDRLIVASGYVDKVLDAEETPWFEEEIQGDVATAKYIEEIRGLKQEVQTLPTPQPPHSIEYNWQRCKARMRDGEGLQGAAWLARHLSGNSWNWTWTVPAAVVCFIAFAQIMTGEVVRVRKAWSPEPTVWVSTYQSGRAQVIWLSGLDYRYPTETVR